MDKLNFSFSGGKSKQTEYIKEAEKTAIIVSKGVEKGEYSELAEKLEKLPSTGISREKYVFERKETKEPILAIIVSVIISIGYLCFLPIGLGTLIYSSEYNAFAVVCIVGTIAVIVVNILMILYAVSKIKFNRRYDRYLNVLRFRNIEIIDDLTDYSGLSADRVIKDLSTSVRMKLVPQGHFGTDNMIFFVSNVEYEQYKEKQAVYDRYYRKQIEERTRMKERTAEMEKIMDQGQMYVKKIHESNDIIKDKIISQKLDRMEKVVVMIFHEVDINPTQADKLGMFLNYYLPTTEKLLASYIEVDEKQIKGKSLEKTKKDIESVLDTINASFEGLLDRFYQEQETDICSDISAMEIIMKQEGLVDM